MIYLGDLILRTGTLCRVGLIGYGVDSTGKSQYGGQYDLSKGVLVDALPQPNIPDGKIVGSTLVDTATKVVSYEYIDRPVSQEDQIQQTIDGLGQQVSALTLQLATLKGGETT